VHDVCVICLGLKELSPPNLNLLHIMQNETQASEPILFILSLGADPSQELQDLAKSTIGADKYHQVCDFLFMIFMMHDAHMQSISCRVCIC